jgi:hypothetical protein
MFDFARGRDGAPIEGFLGDRQEAKVLFILREPNNKDQPAQGFWLRKVLDDASYRRGMGPKYADTVCALARYLLGAPDAIRSCAYINLYAACGEGTASELFYLTYRAYRGERIDAPAEIRIAAEERAAAVKGLIRDFILYADTTHIVTVNTIYDLLRNTPPIQVIRPEDTYADSEKLTLSYRRNGPHNKTFRLCRCEMYGREVTLHEFWHPSYTTYRLEALREAIPDCFD